MEAYSPTSVPMFVGGVVGRIFSPGHGQFVGGCVGLVHAYEADHGSLGGCVGRAWQPGEGRQVGGCTGFARPPHPEAHVLPRLDLRADRANRAAWIEGTVAEIAA